MPLPGWPELRADQLSLEPLPEDELPARTGVAEPGPVTGRASFQLDTRSGNDRRQLADRRQVLRFEPDRRSGKDRRPRRSWEPGSNL